MALATPIIAATYAEIALKGRNRTVFMRKLINNIRRGLKGEPIADVRHIESRVLVYLDDPTAAPRVAEKLGKVFGLQWVSPVVPIPRSEIDEELMSDLEAGREPSLTRVAEVACQMTEQDRGSAQNFRVATRRSDKTFPITSPEISMAIGYAVHTESGLPGKMTDPDLVVNVLVLKNDVLVFTGKEIAFGGLPAGSSGRAMVLLSGGIDSPVAAWLMMRRGIRPEFIHFYSGRNRSEADVDKIIELAKILMVFSPVPLNLHLVPVVPFEMRSIGVVPDNYDMVMFRRFMFKCAERLAKHNNCRALISGDSLGQVASQTIHNLGAISPDIEMPILRPLVGMDKMEITAWSKVIGAFQTSILPYRDCCSIRSPKPILNARPQDLLRFSEEMDLNEAVFHALKDSETVIVG